MDLYSSEERKKLAQEIAKHMSGWIVTKEGWKVSITPQDEDRMSILVRYNDQGNCLYFTGMVKDTDGFSIPVCTLRRTARRKPHVLANDITRHLLPKMRATVTKQAGTKKAGTVPGF